MQSLYEIKGYYNRTRRPTYVWFHLVWCSGGDTAHVHAIVIATIAAIIASTIITARPPGPVDETVLQRHATSDGGQGAWR